MQSVWYGGMLVVEIIYIYIYLTVGGDEGARSWHPAPWCGADSTSNIFQV